MRQRAKAALRLTAAIAVVTMGGEAWAQSDEAAFADPNEIVVSARKRDETILNVPIIATALSDERIDRLQTTSVADLPSLVPGLMIGQSLGQIGSLVAVRGVGSISLDPGVDASVSLNIDGLALGNGLAFTSGMFDLQRIEVLKGPQALFYGKSSPGGVIALRTADPTDDFELSLRGSYEFEARGTRQELVVSGPVGDTLKLRLAAMYAQREGFFRNLAVAVPGTGALSPTDRREPGAKNYVLRGTALWTPTDRFRARLKMNLVYDREIDAEVSQLTSCPQGPGFAPSGIPFIGGDDCKLDRNIRTVFLDPQSFPGILNGGVPFSRRRQKYGSLELEYRLADQLSLNSTTAYYHVEMAGALNPTHTTAAGPAFGSNIGFRRELLTEELRLSSDLSSPVNFMIGGLFEDGSIYQLNTLPGNAAYNIPAKISDGRWYIDLRTYSLFGQLRWNVTPELELAGGGRWTDETRSERIDNLITGSAVPVNLARPRVHSSNFAPELTATYKPTEDLTFFGSFKMAYKSGSFSLGGVPAQGANNAFDDERVKGGEIGFKSRLADRRLSINLAAYYYVFRGLQVGAVEPAANGVPATRTLNAGKARTYGVDFDMTYRPKQIAGLSLRAAVNWNKARYLQLNNIPCWSGQTIAAGCDQFRNPVTGRFTAQDLSDTPMVRAPDWQASLGFDYDMPLGNALTLRLTNNTSISSRYATFLAVGRPRDDQYQRGYAKVDLSLALLGPEERWELALLGKNIGNQITASTCSASNLANGAIFGGDITGGTTGGPAGIGQVGCSSDMGREVWVRATLKL